MEFQVVGSTNQQEVTIASTDRKFIINEYLVIQDEDHDNPIAEVIETSSFNKFIPSVDEKSAMLDDSVINNLNELGFDVENETIHLAKVRLVGELNRPISVGVSARLPEFNEIEHILMKTKPKDGLTLGVIRGTEILQEKLPQEISNVARLFDKEFGILDQEGVPFVLDHYSMKEYPHIGIYGGSGSGKSVGLRVILEELQKKRIPAIVFDPHYEMSFDKPFDNIPEDYKEDFKNKHMIATVGYDTGVDFVNLNTDELCGLLSSVSPLSETMENTVGAIHKKNDSLLKFQNRLNQLIDLFENSSDIEGEDRKVFEKYKNSVAGLKTLQAISSRLNGLVRSGLFEHDITNIEEGLKQRKTVVVRGNMKLLHTFSGYLIKALYKKRRTYQDSQQKTSADELRDIKRNKSIEKFPPFIIATDEAHNFARKGDFSNPTKRVLREIAQEGRKYGVFLILATQRPAILDDTINAQLNTKIIFRTVRSSDLDTIKEETDLSSSEIKRLPFLNSGNCFISSAVIGRAVSVRFRISKTKSPHSIHPFDELNEFSNTDDLGQVLLEHLPLGRHNLPQHHSDINKKAGRYVDKTEIFEVLEDLFSKGLVVREKSGFGYTYHLS